MQAGFIQTSRKTDIQTDRQSHKQAVKHAGRKTYGQEVIPGGIVHKEYST